MKYYALLFTHFFRQMLLLALEVGPVFSYIKKMKAGALPKDHGWNTGLDIDGEYIWPKNIVYQSPSTRFDLEKDKIIATKLGMFLRSMVKRSIPSTPEIPQSQKRRMPHAVNYIHGAIHYNGAIMIFDDFADLRAHLENSKLREDIKNFIKKEKRELTFVLREKEFDPTEYAYCVAAMRVYLPYFTNGNGPSKKPVLWGNKSPYLAINSINGVWMDDMNLLLKEKFQDLMRAPVDGQFFDKSYALFRREVKWVERLYAWLMYLDVRARGFGGQLFFTKRALIEPKRIEEYKDAGGYWKWTNIYKVPHPFQSLPPKGPDSLSVIIPTFNEAEHIGNAIMSVKKAFTKDHLLEIIVVDGGSSDNTRDLAEFFGAKVVSSDPGRGNQMAIGASQSKGEVLFFLHADTEIQTKTGRKLRQFLIKPKNKICTLRLRFQNSNPVYKLLGFATRLDGRFFSYGDQGIVVRRDFYEALGGMPKQPLFEDVEFLLRARKKTRIRSLRAKIHVSDRRFRRRGLIRELSYNTWLSTRYAFGTSPEKLNALYRRT